jgi:hypothetical protein
LLRLAPTCNEVVTAREPHARDPYSGGRPGDRAPAGSEPNMPRYAIVTHTPGAAISHLTAFAHGALGHESTLCGKRYRYVGSTDLTADEADVTATCSHCRADLDLWSRRQAAEGSRLWGEAEAALAELQQQGALTFAEMVGALHRLTDGIEAVAALGAFLQGAAVAAAEAASLADWPLVSLDAALTVAAAVAACARLVATYGTLHSGGVGQTYSPRFIDGGDLAVWGAMDGPSASGAPVSEDVWEAALLSVGQNAHALAMQAATRYTSPTPPIASALRAAADEAELWDAISARYAANMAVTAAQSA